MPGTAVLKACMAAIFLYPRAVGSGISRVQPASLLSSLMLRCPEAIEEKRGLS